MLKAFKGEKLKLEFKGINIYSFTGIKDNKIYYPTNYNIHSNTLQVKEIKNNRNDIIELLESHEGRINIYINNKLVKNNEGLNEEYYKQIKIDVIGKTQEGLGIYNIYFETYSIIK